MIHRFRASRTAREEPQRCPKPGREPPATPAAASLATPAAASLATAVPMLAREPEASTHGPAPGAVCLDSGQLEARDAAALDADGDGLFEPGERIEVGAWVENLGTELATDAGLDIAGDVPAMPEVSSRLYTLPPHQPRVDRRRVRDRRRDDGRLRDHVPAVARRPATMRAEAGDPRQRPAGTGQLLRAHATTSVVGLRGSPTPSRMPPSNRERRSAWV